MYEAIGVTVGIAAGLAVLLWLLVGLAATYVEFGILVVLAHNLVEGCFPDLPALSLGVTLHASDLFFGVVAGACMLRSFRRDALARIPAPLLVAVIVQLPGMALGLAINGMSGVASARSTAYWLIAAYYVLSFDLDADKTRRYFNLWIAGAVGLVVLAVYRWTNMLLDIDDYMWLDHTGIKGRVLPSSHALDIALSLPILLLGLIRGRFAGGAIALLPVLLLTLVGVQQRTVWVCSLVGIALSFALGRGGRGKLVLLAGGGLVLMAAVAIPLLSSDAGGQVASSLSSTVETGASASTGTFGARVNSWGGFMKEYMGLNPAYQLIGSPYGSEFDIELEGGKKQEFGVHNDYLQRLQHGGAVGLVAWCVYLVWAFRRMWNADPRGALAQNADSLLVFLAMDLIYGITYGIPPVHGLWFGILTALIRAERGVPGSPAVLPDRRARVSGAMP